jgi:uncharacterized protein YbcI
MDKPVRDQWAAEIGRAVGEYLRDQLGAEIEDVKAEPTGDGIVLCLYQLFSPAEKSLARFTGGRLLLTELKEKLFERCRPRLREIIEEKTGSKIAAVRFRFNPETGERMETFILEDNAAGGYDQREAGGTELPDDKE